MGFSGAFYKEMIDWTDKNTLPPESRKIFIKYASEK